MKEFDKRKLYSSLQKIRKTLELNKNFPQSLSGACNVSSILVHSLLKRIGVDSEIINNSKHCFNLTKDGFIVDLTATQISKNKFDDVYIGRYIDTVLIVKKTIKGRGFYNLEDTTLLLRGDFDDVLSLRDGFKNDENDVRRIIQKVRSTINVEIDSEENINDYIKSTLVFVDQYIEQILKEGI